MPMWAGRRCLSVALLFMLLMPHHVTSQALSTQNPYKIEAAFLRNFARYVVWPENAFPSSTAPWQIVVLGPDPFGEVLEKTLQNHTEQGRAFRVLRTDNYENLPPCQIIYIAYRDSVQRRTALSLLRGKPVLTVSDAPNFMADGGIIQLTVEDRVRMGINLDQARAALLTIKAKMLEVSSEVLDQGMIREMR